MSQIELKEIKRELETLKKMVDSVIEYVNRLLSK